MLAYIIMGVINFSGPPSGFFFRWGGPLVLLMHIRVVLLIGVSGFRRCRRQKVKRRFTRFDCQLPLFLSFLTPTTVGSPPP